MPRMPETAPRASRRDGLTPLPSEAELTREIGARWDVARTLLNNARAKIGDEAVGLVTLGELMAHAAGRGESWGSSTMHRIGTGQTEPDAQQVLAFCRVCAAHGVLIDPGWLHYGERTSARAPDMRLVPARVRRHRRRAAAHGLDQPTLF